MSQPNLEERIRKVDLSKMSPQEVDFLSEQLGEKLRGIIDKACEDANKICDIYGLQAKMKFCLEEKGKQENNNEDSIE